MCFVNMRIEDVIVSIVEAMLPKFSDTKTVLVMSFDLRIYRKDNQKSQPVLRMVNLMFHRPDNFTKALWNVSKEWKSYQQFTDWHVKSDHEFGWRNDGVGRPFLRLSHELMKEISPKAEGCPDIEASIRFHGGPKLIKLKTWKLDWDKKIFSVEYAQTKPT